MGIVLGAIGLLFLVTILISLRLHSRMKARRAQREAAELAKRAASGEAEPAPPTTKPRDLSWLAIVAFIAYVVLVWVRQGPEIKHRLLPDYTLVPPAIAGLESHVREFAGIDGLRESLSSAKLDGKVIIVDKDKMTLHPLTRALPNDRVAKTPEEVRIVIWVDTSRIHAFDLTPMTQEEAIRSWQASRYGQPQPSLSNRKTLATYKAKWNVQIIELASRRVRYQKTFVGDNPPSAQVTFGMPWGSGNWWVNQGDQRVDGVEILFAKSADANAKKEVIGILGPYPYDDAAEWIKAALGIDQR